MTVFSLKLEYFIEKKVSRNLESKTIIYSLYHLFAVVYRSFHCISSPESVSIIYSGWPGQLHLNQLDLLENKTLRLDRVRWYRVVYFAVKIIINSKSIYISKEVFKMSCYSQWYEYKLFIKTIKINNIFFWFLIYFKIGPIIKKSFFKCIKFKLYHWTAEVSKV